jgi:hypothetical protein
MAAEDGEANAAFVRNEVTRRPRARDTTSAPSPREFEVPVISGEYEDDNKPSKLCVCARQQGRIICTLNILFLM